jgi:hypothetical protein
MRFCFTLRSLGLPAGLISRNLERGSCVLVGEGLGMCLDSSSCWWRMRRMEEERLVAALLLRAAERDECWCLSNVLDKRGRYE